MYYSVLIQGAPIQSYGNMFNDVFIISLVTLSCMIANHFILIIIPPTEVLELFAPCDVSWFTTQYFRYLQQINKNE